jgi:hypothetical protein
MGQNEIKNIEKTGEKEKQGTSKKETRPERNMNRKKLEETEEHGK